MPAEFLNDPFAPVNRARNDISGKAIGAAGSVHPLLGDLAGAVLRAPGIPRTRTRTTHALTLHAVSNAPSSSLLGVGVRRGVIGAVHVLGVSQTRTIEDVFDVDMYGSGQVADVVPQNLTQRTMRVSRYDLYSTLMEQVFGDELIDLTDQAHPFTLRTVWREPGSPLSSRRRGYEYSGCYFQDLGRNLSSDDTRIVNVDATLVWTRRRRVL